MPGGEIGTRRLWRRRFAMNGTWQCMVCGETIEDVDDGWVEWLVDIRGRGIPGSLRLVCHRLTTWHRTNPITTDIPAGWDGCCYGNADGIFRDHHLRQFIAGSRPRTKRLAMQYGLDTTTLDAAIVDGIPTKRPSRRVSVQDKDTWSEDDPPGFKRQRLVRWLMRKPRRVPLDRARLIAARKYPD